MHPLASVKIEIQRQNQVLLCTSTEVQALIKLGVLGPATQSRCEGESDFSPLGIRTHFSGALKRAQKHHGPSSKYGAFPIFTILSLGLILRVFILSLGGEQHWQLQGELMNEAAAVVELGQWYRLWTASLFHQSLEHFLLNICIFSYVSFMLEKILGTRFSFFLAASSIGLGGILSIIFSPEMANVGFSAAIYAQLVVVIGIGFRFRDYPMVKDAHFGWAILPYFLGSVVLSFLSSSIDHFGHLGGVLTGVIFLFGIRGSETKLTFRQPVLWVMSIIVILCVLALEYRGAQWLEHERHSDRYALGFDLPVYWRSGWGLSGETAWLSPAFHAQVYSATVVHPKYLAYPHEVLYSRLDGAGSIQEELYIHETYRGSDSGVVWHGIMNQVDGRHAVWVALFCRGQLEHYVVMRVPVEDQSRYKVYWDRIEAGITLGMPEGLLEAKAYSEAHPKDSTAAYMYARELQIVGRGQAALLEYEHAIAIEASNVGAWMGKIQILKLLEPEALSGTLEAASLWMLYSEELAIVLVEEGSEAQRKQWAEVLLSHYSQSITLRSLLRTSGFSEE